jgi:hypothetical protein
MRLGFGLNFFIMSVSLTYTMGSFWLLYEIYSIKEKNSRLVFDSGSEKKKYLEDLVYICYFVSVKQDMDMKLYTFPIKWVILLNQFLEWHF